MYTVIHKNHLFQLFNVLSVKFAPVLVKVTAAVPHTVFFTEMSLVAEHAINIH